ncbi:MAG: hypothetical protein A2Y48_00285 [Nitrospirae bacterium RIFCSPLOW2_12_42_9]|nr:MAG: hypothetical protein A2Y48_00285 [Nitrospirae bacterium RIFCSPLOW2_12_42_9]HBI24305.1 hypothetical protein [Nitrospiraceae bacterium]
MSSETENQIKSKWAAVSIQRRRFPRIDITLPAEYHVVVEGEERFRPVAAQNISRGGLLLIMPEFQPFSTCLKIKIHLGERSIDAEVKVAWTELLTGREENEFRCGVYFINISEADLEFIRQFIGEYMERER